MSTQYRRAPVAEPEDNVETRHLIPGFEDPVLGHLFVHAVLCALIYPVLLICVRIGRGKTIFWARFVVAAGSVLIGGAVGTSVLRLTRRWMEAAAWATLIHQSKATLTPGVRLKDFAAHTHDPSSILTALRLLWYRFRLPGADRRVRREYDSKAWSLVVLFCVFSIITAFFLPFVIGRIVLIDLRTQSEQRNYQEVFFPGRLSEAQIESMEDILTLMEDNDLRWTLPSDSTATMALRLDRDTIYFPEPKHFSGANQSSTLRLPHWGVRTRCASLQDMSHTIVPLAASGLSYVFPPRSVLERLFDEFSLALPAPLRRVADFMGLIIPGDMLPAEIDVMGTPLIGRFGDTGETYSVRTSTLPYDPAWEGYVTVETVLFRLNTTLAPEGTFAHVVPSPADPETNIGYDAGVCVSLHEPWLLAIREEDVGARHVSIVGKGSEIRDIEESERRIGSPVGGDAGGKWDLQRMHSAFRVAYRNAVNQLMRSGNGHGGRYVPSALAVASGGGHGPLGYSAFSPEAYAREKALSLATYTLPLMSGSTPQLARQFVDIQGSDVRMDRITLGVVVGSMFLLGLILVFFVPTLPHPVPRRGVDFPSWYVAIGTNEIVVENAEGEERMVLRRSMNLDWAEVERGLGELRVRYNVARHR